MFGLNIDPRNPQGAPVPNRLHALGVEFVRFTFKDATSFVAPTLWPSVERNEVKSGLCKKYKVRSSRP
ncbi:MAG: hypothetical protein KDJ65_09860 [Anaerolineae bacterium]|nr:hypothetical protein [Anaerolineae bacterium]